MAALDSIIGGLPLLTARTIIAAFLLIRAALLAPLVVLLILLAGILGLSASLVTHLIVLVLICHLRILSLAPKWHIIKTRDIMWPLPMPTLTDVSTGQLSAAGRVRRSPT